MTYMADAPPKIIPPNHQENDSIVNSGTNGNFLQDISVCMNRRFTKSPLSLALPYGSQIKLTHTTMLYLLSLPEAAIREHIFHELKSGALLFVRQRCDQGCKVKLTTDQVSVTLNNQTILTGPH